MLTTFRAAVAAALFAGFYVFAGAVVLGLFGLGVWLSTWAGRFGVQLAIVAVIAGLGVLVALVKVFLTRPQLPSGVRVEPSQAPELWRAVTDLAAGVGTRAPDEIQLVAEVNAAVVEHARWLGLVGGRRYLLIGVPVLQTLTADQLRAVIAHELGHYSRHHTRLAALTYRGRLSIAETIGRLGGVVRLLMYGYALLFVLVESSVSRRQEYEADLAAVRLVGKRAASTALREMEVTAKYWELYVDGYVTWGLDSGYAPHGVLADFPVLLRNRTEDVDELRQNLPRRPHSWWDSHPPTANRIAAIERLPDLPVAMDGRPATALVPTLEWLVEAVERHDIDFGANARVPMAEYTAHAHQARVQRGADQLYRGAGRLTGDRAPGLSTVVQLVRAGRHAELVRTTIGGRVVDPARQAQEYAGLVRAALAAALVRAGAASWLHTWTGPTQLVSRTCARLDLHPLAAPIASGDPAGTDATMEWLRSHGVEPSAASVVQTANTAVAATVVGAMANLKVDGERVDLIVLDSGLVVVPGLGRFRQYKVRERLDTLTRTPPTELVSMPGHRYLPFEEMSSVRVRRRWLRRTYEIVPHGGALVRIRRGAESEDIAKNGALDQAMAPLVARTLNPAAARRRADGGPSGTPA